MEGKYSLFVHHGKWEVAAEPDYNSAFAPQPPSRVKVPKGGTSTLNFTFKEAGNTLSGQVRNSSNKLLSTVNAWAYARIDNDGFDVITDAPVNSGKFSLKLPDGDYKVGIWIDHESGYIMQAEADADFTGQTEGAITSTITLVAVSYTHLTLPTNREV